MNFICFFINYSVPIQFYYRTVKCESLNLKLSFFLIIDSDRMMDLALRNAEDAYLKHQEKVTIIFELWPFVIHISLVVIFEIFKSLLIQWANLNQN
jgi:hypothetical protein